MSFVELTGPARAHTGSNLCAESGTEAKIFWFGFSVPVLPEHIINKSNEEENAPVFRIRKFLGLPYPHLLVSGTDPEPSLYS